MGMSGTDVAPTVCRIVGGYVACGFAIAYYWFWYVYAGRIEDDNEDKDKKSKIRKNVTDNLPGFMRSELRLPNYSRLRV